VTVSFNLTGATLANFLDAFSPSSDPNMSVSAAMHIADFTDNGGGTGQSAYPTSGVTASFRSPRRWPSSSPAWALSAWAAWAGSSAAGERRR
jgi:hypothetical protein